MNKVITLLVLCFFIKICGGILSCEPKVLGADPMHNVPSHVSLKCDIDGPIHGGSIDIKWRRNGIVYDKSTGRYNVFTDYTIHSNGNAIGYTTLLITNVTFMDNGTYYCEVNGSVSEQVAVDLLLMVHLEPGTSEEVVDDDVDSAEFSCDIAGYIPSESTLSWYHEGVHIQNSTKYSVIYKSGQYRAQKGGHDATSSSLSVLIINTPTQRDAGTYECKLQDYGLKHRMRLEVKQATMSPSPTPDNMLLTTIIAVVAGCLGIIVIILIIIIVVVACNRCRRSEVFVHEPERPTTVTYLPTTNGESEKVAVEEPPPVPVRTYSQSGKFNRSNEPDLPDLIQSQHVQLLPPQKHEARREEPPSHFNHNPPPPPPPSSNHGPPPPVSRKPRRTYYDSINMLQNEKGLPGASGFSLQSVPSPHDVLSGSLQREQAQNPPDFTYPIYHDGFAPEDLAPYDTVNNDYDQIYSEPIEPSMLNANTPELNDEGLPYSAIYDDPKPLGQTEAPLVVSADNIVEIRKLGNGQFGQVILARTKNLSLVDLKLSETGDDRSNSILVAIKKLKTNAETGLYEAFDKEVKFMSRLNHDNVVRLLAICKSAESFIMMEYMENGDLNQFLQKHTLVPDTVTGLGDWEITPIILLYIGVQISSGMHYLASRRFVHRDLATRNCLVGKDFIVKISDFGMSRRLYESAYYRVQGTLVLPIRWMSCETFYGKFSVKSDAWAFGVTLWEVYTLASCDPYDDITDEEVIQDAIRGPNRKLLSRPDACPRDVYDVMLRCWVHDPAMRADFGEIYSRLYMTYTSQPL
jgi:hypothetical protein